MSAHLYVIQNSNVSLSPGLMLLGAGTTESGELVKRSFDDSGNARVNVGPHQIYRIRGKPQEVLELLIEARFLGHTFVPEPGCMLFLVVTPPAAKRGGPIAGLFSKVVAGLAPTEGFDKLVEIAAAAVGAVRDQVTVAQGKEWDFFIVHNVHNKIQDLEGSDPLVVYPLLDGPRGHGAATDLISFNEVAGLIKEIFLL